MEVGTLVGLSVGCTSVRHTYHAREVDKARVSAEFFDEGETTNKRTELLTSLEGTGVGSSVTTTFVAVDGVSPGPARTGAGRRVGRFDGSPEGLVDGRPLGRRLGLGVGLGVGLRVGRSLVGSLEGILEGRAVSTASGTTTSIGTPPVVGTTSSSWWGKLKTKS